ncbi:4,5-DOPA-extradiol-dioxygenase [Sandaracinobacter neustonicus]|nr:4,5-DOPA dioxygenase extradiol [Sandaracinobacter neustonicus]
MENAPPRMPALFIGHGSPMNTLERNIWTDGWRALGAELPKPRALLVVSAHWYIGATAVTAMPAPRTIHDFHGFPPELFAFQYNAPGAPDVAREVAEIAKPTPVALDDSQWGLDHGTWSVLAHLFPKADVPVVQLSIDRTKGGEHHLELASRLNALRDQGIMILSSGNVVHNLGRIDWHAGNTGADWADRFDIHVEQLMRDRPGDILASTRHPDFRAAVPTPDHFIPLLTTAGLAAESGEAVLPMFVGRTMGSLSMTSYAVGLARN